MPVFGAQHYMSLHHVHVKVWKKNHPTAVMSATFVIGMFFLYQVTPNSPQSHSAASVCIPTVQFGWFTVFFWSIFLPLLLTAIHAFLHVKGKVGVGQTMLSL